MAFQAVILASMLALVACLPAEVAVAKSSSVQVEKKYDGAYQPDDTPYQPDYQVKEEVSEKKYTVDKYPKDPYPEKSSYKKAYTAEKTVVDKTVKTETTPLPQFVPFFPFVPLAFYYNPYNPYAYAPLGPADPNSPYYNPAIASFYYKSSIHGLPVPAPFAPAAPYYPPVAPVVKHYY